MKKFVVSIVIISTFVIYSLLYTHSGLVALVPNIITGGSRSSSNTAPAPSSSGTSGTTTTSAATYKDGSYTGSVADAQWGVVQIKATIQGGKITDVQFLQYPNDRNRSRMINSDADPQLVSEAIQAQSANVDIVTGATDSSEAFMQSLADALSQARA